MLVYLSGPIKPLNGYTIEDNVKSAVKIFVRLISQGVNAFCPQLGADHPECHEIDYERWMEYDFFMVDLCDVVLMLDRWETSSGAKREMQYAIEKGKAVFFNVDEILKLRREDGEERKESRGTTAHDRTSGSEGD